MDTEKISEEYQKAKDITVESPEFERTIKHIILDRDWRLIGKFLTDYIPALLSEVGRLQPKYNSMAEPRRDIATLKSKIMRLEGALKKIKKERHAPDWDDHVNTPGDMFKDLKEKVPP